MTKPTYHHDCKDCIFLGVEKCVEKYYDLYFCPQGNIPTVVARFGNAPWEYRSGLSSIEYDQPLKKAYLLARDEGLIKGANHDARRP